jgi:transcriptional regulator with XRE-family HTH domain
MQGSLARKLRVLRAERGLTLRQAAEQAGVRPGTLSELERGPTARTTSRSPASRRATVSLSRSCSRSRSL